MKYLFLFIPLFSFCQKEIPIGTNTIKVTGVTFKEIANSLLDSGYTVEKKDNDLQTITTDPRPYKNYLHYYVYVRVKDSVAYINVVNVTVSHTIRFYTKAKEGKTTVYETMALMEAETFLYVNNFALHLISPLNI